MTKRAMAKKVYRVNIKRFINWYFANDDDGSDLLAGLVECLRGDGKFTITAQELWDGCAITPSWVLENWNGEENVYLEDLKDFNWDNYVFKLVKGDK